MQAHYLAAALAILAGAAAAPLHAAEARDAFSPAVTAFESSDLAAREPLSLPASSAFAIDAAMIDEPPAVEQQSYLPLLYSFLVPGAGEISMGYYGRGIALVAAEVAAWTGYVVKHSDGMDKRAAYESFADAHWTMQKWIDDHPCPTLPATGRTLEDLEACGQATSGSGAWPGYVPYVSKEDDKQHYYENLGKYDWYISGWQDWDPLSNPYARDTALRDEYRAMRQSSNKALDQANEFIWISVAARAFSLVETAIIVHNRRGAADAANASGMALRARPRGFDGGELALEVSFK